MAVYVDDMRRLVRLPRHRWPARWSHLFADGHVELVEFAQTLGMDPAWIQHEGTVREHFDVTDVSRRHALEFGAIPISYPRQVGEMLAARRDAGRKVAWRARTIEQLDALLTSQEQHFGVAFNRLSVGRAAAEAMHPDYIEEWALERGVAVEYVDEHGRPAERP